MSDSTGWIYDPDGIDAGMLSKRSKRLSAPVLPSTKNYRPNSEYHEGKGVWSVKCDVALPCATQNELTAGLTPRHLIANGVHRSCRGR